MKRQSLPINLLGPWAKFNEVIYDQVSVQDLTISGAADRGAGLVATNDLSPDEPDASASVLMVVPHGLVLSLEFVENYAKSDKHLRNVLDRVGEFGRTPRGAILIFLLMQITNASPDVSESIGVSGPLTGYVKFLPEQVDLPTFYSEGEVALLYGTSLGAALEAKLSSLSREYELLREGTEGIPWCRKIWWGEENGALSFDDWKQVDSWYRSRALDLPETGHAMVPCIDMANHASGGDTIALYETDGDGNAVLQLRDQKRLRSGEEITITYGDEKGACEMLFSYGFLESSMESARELFLDLEIPDDDPLKLAKLRISKSPPGFKLRASGDKSAWDGDFVWWSCVNEEDGLSFRVLQSNDGERELKVEWKEEDLRERSLKDVLESDELWDIFQLRAIVLLQARIDHQIAMLNESRSATQVAKLDLDVRHIVWENIVKLRDLEWQLLAKGYQDFEEQKEHLLNTKIVQDYLGSMAADGLDLSMQEDFA